MGVGGYGLDGNKAKLVGDLMTLHKILSNNFRLYSNFTSLLDYLHTSNGSIAMQI